ncbi:hypothetical protein CHCC20375_1585 [Bacillus licheniformis]|nr:hypothetical protein CHCC20375_1585 [Bacillus licheniformis]
MILNDKKTAMFLYAEQTGRFFRKFDIFRFFIFQIVLYYGIKGNKNKGES